MKFPPSGLEFFQIVGVALEYMYESENSDRLLQNDPSKLNLNEIQFCDLENSD